MGKMNFLGKCEYSYGNSLNASRDCLYQSLYICLYLHCLLITRGLLDFWSGDADILTWGRQNCLGSKSLCYQKCYMCSEIWSRPD